MPGVRLGIALQVDLQTDLGIDLCAQSGSTVKTPSDLIATADRAAWLRADTGITLNGSRVSGWTDTWGNANLSQGTAGAQPLYEATGLGGQAAVTCDDGARAMFATLSTPIALGSRPYLFAAVKVDTVPSASKYIVYAASSTAGAAPNVGVAAFTGGLWRYVERDGANSNLASTGLAIDTSIHLVESGLTTGGINQWVLSGTGLSSTSMSATTVATVANLMLFAFSTVTTNGVIGKLAELVLIRSEPSAQTKQLMRTYFASRYGSI